MTVLRNLVLACLCALPQPAVAEVRALLVGVSDYLHLDADLNGPSHDVRLMAEVLQDRGVLPGDMRALASETEGLPQGMVTGHPDRASILAAMAAIGAEVAAGDTVVFYFSGHGALAPDTDGDEGGGPEEILLPADATGWQGSIGAVGNALTDDELADWAQGLTSRGVVLVGLIDACHSATGFRAAGGRGVARAVPPETLGLPEGVADADVPVAGGAGGRSLGGEYVFLYSSQSDQRSFEYPLDGTVWHGEFTLRLAEVLRRAPDASWRQVLAATATAMVQGPARQVPDGEGPLLDAPVFGAGAVTDRLPVAGGRVQAGLLAGLGEGAVVAFHADPVGTAILGHGTLTQVSARDALSDPPPPAGAHWATVERPAPLPPPGLGAPVRADPADGHDYVPLLAALPAPDADPMLVPVLVDGTVALAGPDGQLDPAGPGSTPRVLPLPGEDAATALGRMLDQAGHALALRHVLAAVAGRALTGRPVLDVTAEVRAAPVQGEGCGPPGPATPVDLSDPRHPCDNVWLTVRNASGRTQDVSALYMGADYSLVPLFPQRGLSNRLAPGEMARIGLRITPDSRGLEELWLLAVPADADAPRTDLTGLAKPQATRAASPGRAPMADWLAGLAAPDGQTMRGFNPRPAPLTLLRHDLRILPDKTDGDNG